MVRLKALFASRPSYDLAPDQKHEVVIDGLGEFNGLDYLAAARTADGGTVMAYLPTDRVFTDDLSKMSGSAVQAWWYDPEHREGGCCRETFDRREAEIRSSCRGRLGVGLGRLIA